MSKLSKFAYNLQEIHFNTVFETRRVSEIYDSYFNICQFVNVNYNLFK